MISFSLLLQQNKFSLKDFFIIFSEKLQNFNKEAFFSQGVFLRLPQGRWVLGWGKFQWHEQPQAHQPNFFVTDFKFKNQKKWITPEFYFETTDINKLKKTLKSTIGVMNPNWTAADEGMYKNSFESALKAISEGHLNKLVPISFEKTGTVPEHKLKEQMFLKLLEKSDQFYPYGFWDSNQGIIGLTPEQFFDFNIIGSENPTHQQAPMFELNTMALAGTANIKTPKNYLLNQLKDKAEHAYVVDAICDQLASFGDIQLGELEEVSFQSLKHLKTKIRLRGQLKLNPTVVINNLIQKLHPTPALGGYPQKISMDLLNEIEQGFDRKFFGAPFGFLSKKFEFYSVVAIRNMIWDNQFSYIFSGAGLVKESKYDKEWQELELKRTALKRHFGFE